MILERYCYSSDWTCGRLTFGDVVLYTLERPWRPGLPGGMPFVSCIPDGSYSLLRHARPNGDRVLALRNPGCGVWYSKANVPDSGGRYLILLHAANRVDEVQGCIAPGLNIIINDNRPMVTSSRAAMRKIMDHFERGENINLIIRPALGTKERNHGLV